MQLAQRIAVVDRGRIAAQGTAAQLKAGIGRSVLSVRLADCAPSQGVNPVTQVVDAARALIVGHGDALAPTLGTLACLGGPLLFFVPLAVRAFRKA
jgi:hypothetical protein